MTWFYPKNEERKNFFVIIHPDYFLLSSSSFREREGSAPKYGEQSEAFTWDAMCL
jgi:hypothetical protein